RNQVNSRLTDEVNPLLSFYKINFSDNQLGEHLIRAAARLTGFLDAKFSKDYIYLLSSLS
ncbi:MAG: hypothetical protein IJI53_13750, partial [Clostridia bacterium]|nr:hypothetical protein [Clostridia bacterium]